MTNSEIELRSRMDPKMVTGERFAQLVCESFPVLKDEIEEDAGLLHLQMATLRRFGEEAAQTGDLQAARRCVAFVDEIFADCDSNVRDAVCVSFVENIGYEDSLYKLLTPKLMTSWKEVDRDFQRMAEWRSKKP